MHPILKIEPHRITIDGIDVTDKIKSVTVTLPNNKTGIDLHIEDAPMGEGSLEIIIKNYTAKQLFKEILK